MKIRRNLVNFKYLFLLSVIIGSCIISDRHGVFLVEFEFLFFFLNIEVFLEIDHVCKIDVFHEYLWSFTRFLSLFILFYLNFRLT